MVFAMLSVLIVWAEATIVSPVDISPLSLLIKGTDNAEFGVQLLTLLPLVRRVGAGGRLGQGAWVRVIFGNREAEAHAGVGAGGWGGGGWLWWTWAGCGVGMVAGWALGGGGRGPGVSQGLARDDDVLQGWKCAFLNL